MKNKFNLLDFNKIEKERIDSDKRNIILKNKKQLDILVEESFEKKTNYCLHFGKISLNRVKKISTIITNIPRKKQLLNDIEYDLSINQSEIRHISNNKKLYLNNVKYFLRILPVIILTSTNITYSKNSHNEGIRFSKK